MTFLNASWADVIIIIIFGYIVIDMARTISKLKKRVKTIEEEKKASSARLGEK